MVGAYRRRITGRPVDAHGFEVVNPSLYRGGFIVNRWCGTKATRLTCTDGGAALASLEEGRCVAAVLHLLDVWRPAATLLHDRDE